MKYILKLENCKGPSISIASSATSYYVIVFSFLLPYLYLSLQDLSLPLSLTHTTILCRGPTDTSLTAIMIIALVVERC